jgi:hypothetical protein
VDETEILRAAELLADAKVDTIAWNGTSASWLGREVDPTRVSGWCRLFHDPSKA